MRRFFVPSAAINDTQALLSGPEFHHLRHVLRLEVGSDIILCDERGAQHHGFIAAFSPDSAAIRLTASSAAPLIDLSVSLAVGLLKGQKMDVIIEKATEIGVQTIIPVFSTHSVASLPAERQRDRLARWQRIAQSAAKQSGSPLPHITAPHSFEQLLEVVPDTAEKILFYEHERSATLKAFAAAHPHLSCLWMIIGPEGGFSPQEVEQSQAAGFTPLSLGPSILRAETASIVALAVCQFLWREARFPLLP